MSSKIDGVPRELLERLLYNLQNESTKGELRALLAAPVVERQPVAYLIECEWRAMTSYAKNRDPIETYKQSREVSFNQSRRPQSEVVRNVVVSPLYTAPPELAELQATIERLTAENERVSEFRRRWIRRTLKARDERDQLSAEIKRLKAEQGEPVALYPRRTTLKARNVKSSGSTEASRIVVDHTCPVCGCPNGHMGWVCTSQPAPVSVVLPERKAMPQRDDYSGDEYGTEEFYEAVVRAEEHNACLDKVKELNK